MSRNTGMTIVFQSTLPIQGETGSFGIDITLYHDFNPLSLYRERHAMIREVNASEVFQSTLPIQGETPAWRNLQRKWGISIHSPYTGRDQFVGAVNNPYRIFQSTLPIQGETLSGIIMENDRLFQSTLPIQGETFCVLHSHWTEEISIHSPYTGRDGNQR